MKIAVIGNAGAGKTTLSRRLALLHGLPIYHVDSYQFGPDLQIKRYADTIQILSQIQDQESWLIDGFGPLDIIEKRFQLADKVVLIDFPIWRHFWWLTKRQIKSAWWRRPELSPGISEFNLSHTIKLYKTVWQIHTKMRPELLRILARPTFAGKVITIHSYRDWLKVFKQGLSNTSLSS